MNAELVLYSSDVYAAVALVVDKHRQATTVARAFLRAGKDKVNVAVAVGDEALAAVQTPAVVGLVISGLEHNALKVGTCIGLGEVHRHCCTAADAGNEALTLVLVAELVESFDTVLQRPDILKTGIGSSYNLVYCGVRH